jgi:hypothetical protein
MDKKIAYTGIVVYILSAVISFFVFKNFLPGGLASVTSPVPLPTKTANGLAFDQSLPKTQACPINGVLYSKQQEAWWQKHGPLGIMVENSTAARPQSGISKADIVYEAVAEGGITRFLLIFYCQDANIVGPVRSARTYFVDLLSEYGPFPLYAHVGGANTPGPADALGQINNYGWQGYNDLNQFSIGFPVYVRDYDRLGKDVATEHTMYSSTTKLWDYAAQNRGLTNVDKNGKSWDEDFTPYTFKDDAPKDSRPASQTVSFDFWDGQPDYAVSWKYDNATNLYLRSNGGKPHIDLDTGKQLTAKNLVILFMKESRANDGYENNLHMLYGDKGTGKAKIFMDGQEINGTWSKANRTAHLYIKDNRGKNIDFDRGTIWFSVVSPDTDISVE